MILFLCMATFVAIFVVLAALSFLIGEWNFAVGTAFAFSSGLILGIEIIPRQCNWFVALEKRLEKNKK